jgi:hypothetical protein
MKFHNSIQVDVPNGNRIVWRYLSTWKFEKLVQESALFFSAANMLSDQYEVTIPESTIKKKRKLLKQEGYKGHALKEQIAAFNWEANPLKDRVLVNCWSLRRHESYALWKIYLGGDRNGVAIRSTVASIRRSIEKGDDPIAENFSYARVKYRNYLHPDNLSRESLATTKKPFYDFEEEFRIFILRDEARHNSEAPSELKNHGRNVQVDLKELVKSVYVSPFADSSYVKNVGRLLQSVGVGVGKIQDSAIREFPTVRV